MSNSPDPAVLRATAAVLEQQAAVLRDEADKLDGGAMPPPDFDPFGGDWFKPGQSQDAVGFSETTIRRAIARHPNISVKIGGSVFVSRSRFFASEIKIDRD